MRYRLLVALAVVSSIAAGIAGRHAPDAHGSTTPVRWCGAAQSAVDRKPNRVKGYQVHVIYVVPPGGPNLVAERMSQIATDIAGIDAWWRAQDPTRAPRWDLAAFPGCASTFGNLDITVLHTAISSIFKSPNGGVFTTDYSKKYLVVYEGNPGAIGREHCGVSQTGHPQPGSGYSYALVWIGPGCAEDVGDGDGFAAYLLAHELVHELHVPAAGANPGPPHLCSSDNFHFCDSSTDLMAGMPVDPTLATAVLDDGRDDYYNHSGTWWDARDSAWLRNPATPTHTLTFATSGSGTATIQWLRPGDAFAPPANAPYEEGGTCPSDCTGAWEEGSLVFYKATAARGSHVLGSTGPCEHITDQLPGGQLQPQGWCAVHVNADTTITVNVARIVAVTFVIRRIHGGYGYVKPAGCDRPCTITADLGSRMLLTAVPFPGSRFAAWAGACHGKARRCRIVVGESTRIIATFAKKPKKKRKPRG
jgi:hypothetical protein